MMSRFARWKVPFLPSEALAWRGETGSNRVSMKIPIAHNECQRACQHHNDKMSWFSCNFIVHWFSTKETPSLIVLPLDLVQIEGHPDELMDFEKISQKLGSPFCHLIQCDKLSGSFWWQTLTIWFDIWYFSEIRKNLTAFNCLTLKVWQR